MRRDGRTSASQRPSAALLEQQHLPAPAARAAHRDARAQHAARVGDDEVAGVEQVDEVGEAPVLDRPVAPVHEQARGVPALGGPLRDQLLGQRVVELVGPHASSLAGDRRGSGERDRGDRRPMRRSSAVPPRASATRSRSSCAGTAARVYALALRICRNPDDAEDALQETFIAAYRALPRFDRRARVSTWLYRIATNKCYDILARRRPTADPAALPGGGRSARPVRAQRAERAADAGARRAARAVPRGGAPVRRVRPHAGRGGRGGRRAGGHDEIAQLPRSRPARDRTSREAARNRRREAGSNRRGRHRSRRARGGRARARRARRAAAAAGRRGAPRRAPRGRARRRRRSRRAGRGAGGVRLGASLSARRGRRRGGRVRPEHGRRRHRRARGARARCATRAATVAADSAAPAASAASTDDRRRRSRSGRREEVRAG